MFHVKHDSRLRLASIDDAGRERLERYTRLLADRAVPLGFVSASDRDTLLDRHVLDSLRAVPCIQRNETHIADIGSGAGLPGIPVAVALPDRTVTLIEPKRRRAAFLELAITELELRNVSVIIGRSEDAPILADVCLMRAVTSPERAWEMARHVVQRHGRLLIFTGASFDVPSLAARTGLLVETCALARHGLSGPLVIMREGVGRSDSSSEG
jgi:16S rRNA (guanine527-N7)-methyltransferase